MNAISSRIIVPGVIDMPSEEYHADPCDTPSLSAGMISDLLVAPAKCREKSQRLNPAYAEAEGAEKFSIGTVSHIMFLEPELFAEKVQVVDADDWRTASAKAMRQTAKADGKTAILSKHMERIFAARRVFMANDFTREAFANGVFEQSMFWRHPVYGFWCRARPDFMASNGSHMNDYKATANADPAQFGKHAYSMGYHRRAAWYLEGYRAIYGITPDHYWFCNQEVASPHLTSVVELDMQSLEAGQAENDRAAGIFERCLASGEWPGYRHRQAPDRDMAFRVSLPTWAFSQIDERNY